MEKPIDGKAAQGAPTKELVREWCRRDMASASYFLSMLIRYPDIVDSIADQLFERVNREENGALIDHVTKTKK